MALVDFVTRLHKATARDYLGRVTSHDKAECAEIALRWDQDYWDGERHLGYGGYRYDGRWRPVAEAMVRHYQLAEDARILDVGCGKGFCSTNSPRCCRGRGLPESTFPVMVWNMPRRKCDRIWYWARQHDFPGRTTRLTWCIPLTRCTTSTTTNSGPRFGRSSASAGRRSTSRWKRIATNARR